MAEKLSLEEALLLGSRLTDEERREIKGALRKSFRLSFRMSVVLNAARVELPPALKKDGNEGKRNQVRYKCAACQQLFQQKNVAVDHIEPVVPLYREEKTMSGSELVRGIYCPVSNLQVLCNTKIKDLPKGVKSCHYNKTQEEKFLRKKWAEWKKQRAVTDSWVVFYEKDEEGSLAAKQKVDQITQVFKSEYADYLLEKQKKLQEKEEKKKQRLAKKLSK